MKRIKDERKIKTEGVIFGGIYKPKKNPFRHSYRAEYALVVFLVAIFAFFVFVLKIAGAT